jgi:phosphinothricin acetyltransferase
LYETLFALLKLQGYVNVYAGVTLPNEKSEGFHLAQGFEVIGNFTKIGYKLGKWRDVRWFQLHLNAHADNPPLPKKVSEVQHYVEFQAIMDEANRRINL